MASVPLDVDALAERNASNAQSEEVPNTSQLDLDILLAWVVEELLWDAAEWASILTSTQCNKPDAASGTRAPKRRLYDEDSESSGMDGLIEELVATRSAVRDLAVRANDFRFVVRGGEWCMVVHGVPYDSFRGEAVPGVAAAFCQNYGMARSSTFAVGLYGLEHCTLLTNSWIDRMQQFLIFGAAQGHRKSMYSLWRRSLRWGCCPGRGTWPHETFRRGAWDSFYASCRGVEAREAA